jgi:hypothetical protein
MGFQRYCDVENRKKRGKKFVKENTKPSCTNMESFGKANIHEILKNFRINGTVENNQDVRPIEDADFSDNLPLREQLDRVLSVRNQFLKLPFDVRKRFDHNPLEMAEFLSDRRNIKEAKKLGLVVTRENPTIVHSDQMARAYHRMAQEEKKAAAEAAAAAEKVKK